MDVRRTVEAVWRIESARLVIALTRLVHDVGLAEDVAQEAFASALEQWPDQGVPDNPGAWLMTVARRKAIDLIRRDRMRADRYAEIATDPLAAPTAGPAGEGRHAGPGVRRLPPRSCRASRGRPRPYGWSAA